MSEHRQTTARITLRLMPAEDAAVRAAARLAGQTLSFWARRELLRAAGEKPPAARRLARFDQAALIALAGRVGQAAGLMQILRLDARAGRTDPAAVERVAHALEALVGPLRDALRASDDEPEGGS